MITRGFGVAEMRPREMLHPLKMAKLREMVYSASSKAMGHIRLKKRILTVSFGGCT